MAEGSKRENKIVNVLGFACYKKHEKQNNKFVSEKWRDQRIQTVLYHIPEQWKRRIKLKQINNYISKICKHIQNIVDNEMLHAL